METIRNYLDNMFASLPKTSQMEKLKNDILSNMEDKYNELKSNGKSENEAIGIVISEFGNIDELMNELGIECGNEEEVPPLLAEEEVHNYLEVVKKSAKMIGFGVVLCILAAAQLFLIVQLAADGVLGGISEDFAEVIGTVFLFLLVAPAVGLFIYSGMKLEKFKYLENDFVLPTLARSSLKQKYNEFQPTFTLAIIVGVTLCILSPITLFITSTISESASIYGLVVLLLIVAVAVYILIYYGMVKDSLKKLLKIDYLETKRKKEENKVISAVAAIVWPLAVIIFLVSGFIFDKWHINWIVFAITGLLFGIFSGVYNILKGKNNKI